MATAHDRLEEATDQMQAMVDDERPFTSEERAFIREAVEEVRVFAYQQANWWNWTSAVSYLVAFIMGFILGKLPS